MIVLRSLLPTFLDKYEESIIRLIISPHRLHMLVLKNQYTTELKATCLFLES